MSISTDTDLLLDSLHEAREYNPKRAIRYFTDEDHRSQVVPLLLEEMEEVLHNPEHFVENESQFLLHSMLILAHLHEEDAIALFQAIGYLDPEAIEVFLGEHLFDSVSVAFAEMFKNKTDLLKEIIEDPEQDPMIRASGLQAMLVLFGKGIFTRSEIIEYFLHVLKQREEKIPYVYDLIAGASTILHPAELIDELKLAYAEKYIDPEQIGLSEIEEMLEQPKEEIAALAQEQFNADLEDLMAHYDLLLTKSKKASFERNDPCPCCSGLKYKKCCF